MSLVPPASATDAPPTELGRPRLLAPGEGDHIAFLGTASTVKAGGDITGGNLTVIELLAPAGFGPPPHRHDVEDEMFFVLDGEVGFWVGDDHATYGAGGFVWAPKGLPHRFQVSDTGPARMFQLSTPAQFEHFALALGERIPTATLPPPPEVDVEELIRISAEFDIEILPSPG